MEKCNMVDFKLKKKKMSNGENKFVAMYYYIHCIFHKTICILYMYFSSLLRG